MRRTYRSKKETGGGLDPRDVLLTLDSKNSLFDAFYIQNIKQTKRELSIAPTVQFAASNKVRKRKYVKRLKEQDPIISESTSRSVFLTPDKSFRVNKAPDLFDQLLNSSNKNESIELMKNNISSNKLKGKTYCRNKGLKKKKINNSSSDSLESDKENSICSTDISQNSSDILSHKLLIEREKQHSTHDESIANIVKNFSLYKGTKDNISSSLRGVKKCRKSQLLQTNQGSPLCSTPFIDKYRGKSIYNFSPIPLNLDDSPKTVPKHIENEDENSLIVLSNSVAQLENSKVVDDVPNEIKNELLMETIQYQSPILQNRSSKFKNRSILNFKNSKVIENTLQTTEFEPFLGFSKSIIPIDIEAIANKCKELEKDTIVINESIKQIDKTDLDLTAVDIEQKNTKDNSFEDISDVSKNNVERSGINTSVESNDANSNSEGNESLYDTCNSDEFEEDSNKEPIVILEKLNDSIFQNYLDKMTTFNDSDETDDYASMIETISNSSNTDLNVDVQDISNSDDIVSVSSSDNMPYEEICVSFVTTRRRKDRTDDLFLIDNSLTSASSSDFDKTVINKNNVENLTNDTLINVDKKVDDIISDEIVLDNSNEANVTLAEIQDINISNDNVTSTIPMNSRVSIRKSKIPIKNNLLDGARNSLENWKNNCIKKSFSMELNSSKDNTISTHDSSTRQGIVLQPGKRWERSLSIYRRMTVMADHFDHSILDEEPLNNKGRKYRQSVIETMEMQEKASLHNESINSRRSTFVSKPSRSTIRIVRDDSTSRTSLCSTSILEESQGYLTEDCDDTLVELSKLSIADSDHEVTVLEKLHDTSNRFPTARDYVLRRCNQTDFILFDECYPETALKNCRKIGEGVYGEVFLWRAGDGLARVLKIIPIAGDVKVNGENQKGYEEIISEIVIAMELSALRAPIEDIEKHFDEGKGVETLDLHSVENATDVFNEVLAVRCVQGAYPARLLDLWELYDESVGSDNDSPAALPRAQRYLALELAPAGDDLEAHRFVDARQAHALLRQLAFALAVGEEAYEFEHRDLHWGNVLILPTDQKYATFVLRGRAYRVCRHGVRATVIDYSLSSAALRLAAGERARLYNDLGADDALFDAVGDYQFDVYRLMRDRLGNDWKNFEPYTNILWLHYTVDKMITALRYTRTNTKIHKHYIAKLKDIKNRILDYGSAVQYVLTDNEF